MDRKSKILLIIVVIVSIISIGFTFYKTIIQNNFEIVNIEDESSSNE